MTDVIHGYELPAEHAGPFRVEHQGGMAAAVQVFEVSSGKLVNGILKLTLEFPGPSGNLTDPALVTLVVRGPSGQPRTVRSGSLVNA